MPLGKMGPTPCVRHDWRPEACPPSDMQNPKTNYKARLQITPLCIYAERSSGKSESTPRGVLSLPLTCALAQFPFVDVLLLNRQQTTSGLQTKGIPQETSPSFSIAHVFKSQNYLGPGMDTADQPQQQGVKE